MYGGEAAHVEQDVGGTGVCSLLLSLPQPHEQLIWELGLFFFLFFLIILNQLPLMK